MLDTFQEKLALSVSDKRAQITAYFESLNRSEAMSSAAREKLLEKLYSGAPFETVGIEYLESIKRAERVKSTARDNLIKALRTRQKQITEQS